MYPPSPYAKVIGSFPIPVDPPGVNPGDPPLVYIGINCAWLPYIAGALTQLLLETTWKVGTSADLFKVQGQAFDLIALFNCATAPSLKDLCANFGNGADTEFVMPIRQSPDNPCLLQISADGLNWCTFADISKCVPMVSQFGGGTMQPPPGGGQACYTAFLNAQQQWLLPTQLNTGDVITISDVQGAGTDGAGLWWCPNGQAFFAGQCVGTTVTQSGDPLNTAPHMSLVVQIGSTWFEVGDGATITVPSGAVLDHALFQVNDTSLGDNSGSYQFKVCVTNNQAQSWTKTFDFTLNDGGFVSDAGTGGAAYIPGTGWQSNNAGANAMGFKRTGLATYTLTSAELHMLLDTPLGGAQLYVDDGTSGLPATPYSGTGAHVYFTNGNVTITNGVLRFGADGTADSLGRHQIYQKVVLQGTGPSPF